MFELAKCQFGLISKLGGGECMGGGGGRLGSREISAEKEV